jgi:hypothetical protein
MIINLLQHRLKIFIFLVTAFLSVSQVTQAFNYTHPVTPSLVDVTDNTWVKVDQGSVTAPGNIMSYSGGWYDPQHHQFCIFGGGHWDYSGNEVWCLDIVSLTWQEMYAPDVVTSQGGNQGAYRNYDNSRYPGALFNPAGESIENANPVSKHTYDQMEYVEGLGPVVWGGYSWGDGGQGWCDACKDTWAFNFTTANWQYLYDGTNPSPNFVAGVGASAYSTADNLLYALVTGDTWTFNPVNNRWTQLNTTGNAPYSIEMTMEYDSKRNVLYTFGGTWPDNPNLYRFDIATKTWTRLSPNGAGPGVNTVQGPGLAYDEANDVLLVYKNGNIWAYNPNENSWTQYSPAFRPPSGGYDAYGRFRYDPINNGAWFHTMQNGEHTTWFYRFSNSGTPPTPTTGPSITFNANPMSVVAGGQTALTWTSNADSCNASGDWSDSIASSGTATKMLTNTSTYVLTCTLNGVQAVDYVTVQVTSSGGNNPPANDDTDTDGLPDVWEQQYFGNLLSDGNDDNDQDGFTNWDEYNQGTDPTIYNAPDSGGSGGSGGTGGGSGGSGDAAPTENSNATTLGAGAFNIFGLLILLLIQLIAKRQLHREK